MEVYLHWLAQGGRCGEVGGSQAAVTLLDWFKMETELVMVMERPLFSTDLQQYIKRRGGYLPEEEVKVSVFVEIAEEGDSESHVKESSKRTKSDSQYSHSKCNETS